MSAAAVAKPVPGRPSSTNTLPVVRPPERAQFGHAGGRHLVVDNENLAWPETNAGDILDIDFDVREYRGEGLYLVHRPAPAGEVVGPPGRFPFSSQWTGVRRFTTHVGQKSGLHCREPGLEGWQWNPVSEEVRAQLQFLGKVHDIYRRAGRGTQPGIDFVGRMSAITELPDGTAAVTFQPGGGRTLTLSGLTDAEVRRVAPLMMDAMKLELTA